jgi:hypothetical protein
MANITNTETTEIVMTNNIALEGKNIRIQIYKINSMDPDNYGEESRFDYSATAEDKAAYMANKADFRQQETAFEDKVFAKIEEIKAQNTAKQ